MDFGFIAYIFICIVAGLGSFKILSDMDRFWTAIIVLILFTLIFIFFGTRWFKSGNAFFRYEGAWPPIVNMCPDYLVYFKNGQQDTCIDLVGVNRSGGALKPWAKDDIPTNPPQDTAKYFPYVYRPGMDDAKLKQLCNATQDAGLTWEGITNGDACTFPSKVE